MSAMKAKKRWKTDDFTIVISRSKAQMSRAEWHSRRTGYFVKQFNDIQKKTDTSKPQFP